MMMTTRTVSIKLSDEQIKRFKQKFNADTDTELLRSALEKETVMGFWASKNKISTLKKRLTDVNQKLLMSTKVNLQLTEKVKKSTEVYQSLLKSTDENKKLTVDNQNLRTSLQQQQQQQVDQDKKMRDTVQGALTGVIRHYHAFYCEVRRISSLCSARLPELTLDVFMKELLEDVRLKRSPIAKFQLKTPPIQHRRPIGRFR